jgi:hypothetical protein
MKKDVKRKRLAAASGNEETSKRKKVAEECTTDINIDPDAESSVGVASIVDGTSLRCSNIVGVQDVTITNNAAKDSSDGVALALNAMNGSRDLPAAIFQPDRQSWENQNEWAKERQLQLYTLVRIFTEKFRTASG